MKYQPHIDGLRAIAVVPVVIFHLGSSLIPGGYVGVDIFFVISGFLITTILLEDIAKARYSLFDFYKRRILRILPALALVLLATFLISDLLFFENERIETGESIIATAAFISNFYFWMDAGYFTAPAETKPLLHTWSLAVEEQFYIFFPPVLFAVSKYAKKYLLHIIGSLILASLAGCIILTFKHQPTAFYMLPTRAWELGVGVFFAILTHRGFVKENGISGVIGLFGLVLTLFPMFTLDSTSVFPGVNAIAPVLGAMLLIGWGGSGITGAILSSRPFVEIGKISYSLYLWHWPVIVFWKAYSGEHLSTFEMIGLGLVSCALGAVSTYVIERPFRSAEARSMSTSKVNVGGGIVLIGLAGIGALAMSNTVRLRTIPENVQQIAATVDYRTWPDFMAQFRPGSCYLNEADGSFDAFDRSECTTFDPERRNVLLIGDSHAAQLWGALQEAMPDSNVMQATSSGCRALLGAGGAQRCTDLRHWVFDDFLPSHNVDLVILGGRWAEHEIQFVNPTLTALKALSSHVVVIGPTVEYEGSFPEILARNQLTGEEFDFASSRTPGRVQMNELMRQAVDGANIPYVDVLGTICEGESCLLFAPDGVPMHFDYGHVTLSGARYVVRQNLQTFAGPDEDVGSIPNAEGN
ncbi:hypothetical protein A8B78_21050 [Jannaschia sp. EhC01]|nr:hypothetical protein A8B78_21050 [Jannaschia sp. EhC01]